MPRLRHRSFFIMLVCMLSLAACKELPIRLDDLTQLGLESAAPTEGEVSAGLKEALAKGVSSAVRELGRTDGFRANDLVRISMPQELDTLAQGLRRIGKGRYVDEFEMSLNRAAEQAVPKAADVFADAIRAMNVRDAIGIIRGGDNAATEYFRKTTSATLQGTFLPIVRQQTNKVGVTASYKKMLDRASLLQSLTNTQVPDLDTYVTDKALDGLFTYVAIEEKKIRDQPLERSTELLRKVFGYYTGS